MGRHFLDRTRPIPRHLVEHPQEAEHLGDGTNARSHYREREALHRLRCPSWIQRRAGRRMEPRLGRRRADQLPEVLSRLRHRGGLQLCPFEGRALHRSHRDLGQHPPARGADGRSLCMVQQVGHPRSEDRICGPLFRRKGIGQVAVRCASLSQGDRNRCQASHHDRQPRASHANRPAAHLAQPDDTGRRARTGIQCLGREGRQSTSPHRYPTLHTLPGRTDRLHTRHLQLLGGCSRHSPPLHPCQATGRVRSDLQPPADGCRCHRKLRRSTRTDVHRELSYHVEQDPCAPWRNRQVCDRGTQGARWRQLVGGQHHQRRGTHFGPCT